MRLFSVLFLTLMALNVFADDINDQLKRARAALLDEDFAGALKAADKVVEIDPKSPKGYLVRAEVFSAQRKHLKAIEDYNKAYELDKKLIEAINERGGEQFKLGKIKESLQDFDAFLKERPKAYAAHWRRGISLYYDAQYEEGAKQFKAGERVFSADVENAFWHYLCNAKLIGVEKARKALLTVGPDERIPMMKVYELIQGKANAADVIAQAEKAEEKKQSRNEMLFYANLYVALNFEAEGNAKKCQEHLETAVKKHKIGHYMWDVANVHLELLQKKK